jgi:GT2 family glycosyltransferase
MHKAIDCTDISIVILNTNDRIHLEGCLESLANCTKSRTVEIIVVDNASSDGSCEMVEARFPGVKLIRNESDFGFTKGNNVGIKASQGNYVYLLNTDLKILDGCIDVLADFLDQNPRVGLAGPKVLNADMTHQSSCRRSPTLWNNVCDATGLARAFKGSKFFSGEHMLYFHGDRVMDVDVLVGCFSAMRRKALDQVGLLDEGLYMYGDDLDWCKRCWEAGWRVVFCPGAEAIHYRGGSTKHDPVKYSAMQQRSLLYYWKKHHGLLGLAAITCLSLVHSAIRYGFSAAQLVLKPSTREQCLLRMKTNSACLRALVVAGK